MSDAFDRIEQQLLQAASARATRASRRLSTKALVVLGAIALAGTGGAFAAIKTSQSSFSPTDATSYAAAQQAFGVFRQGEASLEAATLARNVVNGRAANAVDPASTRLARVDGRVNMYAMAGGSAVCLLQRGPDTGGQFDCSLLKDLADGSNIMFGIADLGTGSYRLSGMVADGVQNLVVETTAGTQPLSAQNNVIAKTVNSKPLEVDWTAADGSAHQLDLQG
jgi:hypothetical protein